MNNLRTIMAASCGLLMLLAVSGSLMAKPTYTVSNAAQGGPRPVPGARVLIKDRQGVTVGVSIADANGDWQYTGQTSDEVVTVEFTSSTGERARQTIALRGGGSPAHPETFSGIRLHTKAP
jgi:hypothetical protein